MLAACESKQRWKGRCNLVYQLELGDLEPRQVSMWRGMCNGSRTPSHDTSLPNTCHPRTSQPHRVSLGYMSPASKEAPGEGGQTLKS